jgi:phage terminase small subunit
MGGAYIKDGRKMPRVTLKMARFAQAYLETSNARKSAEMAGYNAKTRETMQAIGTENLRNPTVRQLIERYSHKSIKNMNKLANKAKSEQVQYYANKDILDRAGYRPADESTGNKTLVINISGESAERYGLLSKVQELSTLEAEQIEKPSENG